MKKNTFIKNKLEIFKYSKIENFCKGFKIKEIKNFTIFSNSKRSLKRYEEYIKNFFTHKSKLFFCKKSINKPSCKTNSLLL